ncbi:MAG: methyl-accepting chemotaxis protein [Rhodocyclaceae bacterium]
MFRSLFNPAIWLMGRMRYPFKFLLLGILAMLILGYLFYNLYDSLNQTVEYSRFKRSGNAAVESISRLVQNVQAHRGLSAAVLNGNDGLRERQAAKEKEVNDALQTVAGKLPASLLVSAVWKEIAVEWDQLKSVGPQKSAPESFAAHTKLIDKTLAFNIDVADETSLTFDPNVDTYYLVDTTLTKLPLALERLGQMRARGTGILTRKQISEQQKVELSSLTAELNYATRSLQINLQKTARYNPGMEPALHSAAESIVAETNKVTRLVNEDIVGGIFATAPEEYFNLTTTVIDDGYKQAYDILQPALRSLIDARAERARDKLMMTSVISILILAVIGYCAIGTYYTTVGSLATVIEGIQRIAAGDLTARVVVQTEDEHRQVGQGFNDMAAAFAELLGDVQRGAHQVLETSLRIAETSAQVARSTEQQSQSAAGMAASIEEMSTGVDNIAEHALDAHGVSTEAGDLASQGADIVNTVVTKIGKIAEMVNASAETIAHLGDHSERISAIVGVIKEIADQTNLLALNAAIEAARAGESGRGFAVVADEVRKLAERTAKSTQEISEMIGAMQSGAEKAVEEMADGVIGVAEGVDMARRAGDAMVSIQNGAGQVVDRVGDISAALREQSAAGTEIAKHVEQISHMAEENHAASGVAASVAGELQRLAEMLEGRVRRFKIA